MGMEQLRLFLKIVVVTLVLPGCGNQASKTKEPARDGAGSSSSVGNITNIKIPTLSSADSLLIGQAQGEVTKKCMHKAGFEYRNEAMSFSSTSASEHENLGVRLAILPEYPGERGYGLDVPPPQPTTDPYYESLSSEAKKKYELAHGGTKMEKVVVKGIEISRPGDGCRAEGENTLYPDDEYFLLDSQRSVMMMELGKSIAADVRWTEVKKRWSECMKTKGYTYDSPGGALMDLENRSYSGLGDPVEPGQPPIRQEPVDKAAVRREEIAVAKQDYACQQQVQYAAITQTVKNEAVTAVSEKSEGAFERLLELQQKALVKAKEILNKK
jgi:hypothetical protein